MLRTHMPGQWGDPQGRRAPGILDPLHFAQQMEVRGEFLLASSECQALFWCGG